MNTASQAYQTIKIGDGTFANFISLYEKYLELSQTLKVIDLMKQ